MIPLAQRAPGAFGSGQLFGFTGRKYDRETGLYYFRARYYDPSDGGRFLSTDPVGYADQFNLYTYCNNDGLNCTDPSGEQTEGFIDGMRMALVEERTGVSVEAQALSKETGLR